MSDELQQLSTATTHRQLASHHPAGDGAAFDPKVRSANLYPLALEKHLRAFLLGDNMAGKKMLDLIIPACFLTSPY